MRAASAAVLSLGLSGCTALGTVLIPSHPDTFTHGSNSALEWRADSVDIPGVLHPERIQTGNALISSSLAGPAGIVAGIAATQVRKGIEAEQKRYNAKYSALASHACAPSCKAPRLLVFRQLVRSHAQRDTPNRKVDVEIESTLASLVVRLDTLEGFARLSVAGLEIQRSVSKVYWPHLRRASDLAGWSKLLFCFWHWPADLLWLPWSYLDDSVYTVEFKARVQLEALTARGRSVALDDVEFPLGKTSANHLDRLGCAGDCQIPPSPLLESPADVVGWNAVVTLEEANDFGDVVGDAADQVRKHESDLAEELTRALGGDRSPAR